MNETVRFEYNDEKGCIYLQIDGEIIAQLTFKFSGNKRIVIDHVLVDEAYNGKGYGKKMVAAAVEFAREKEIKISPLCPFARNVLERTVEYKDVL
jgi:uncharacterized protein